MLTHVCSSPQMIEDKATLTQYSRSVTMPKEAFNKAVCQHMLPFVSVLRFNNLISVRNNIKMSPLVIQEM